MGQVTTSEQKQQPVEETEAVDMSKGMGGFLSGLAKKTMKKKPSEEKKKPGEGSVIFSSYSEIRKIDTSSVAAADFEVPAGYKKK